MVTVRVQTRAGVKKVEVEKDDKLKVLYDKLFAIIKADRDKCLLYKSRKMLEPVPCSDETVLVFGIEHGQMLCLKEPKCSLQPVKVAVEQNLNVEEDAVDKELWRDDGRISGNECKSKIFKVENLALEPWDEGYKKEKGIKLLSFHSFMREKLSKEKSFKLENQKVALRKNTGSQTSLRDLPPPMTLCRQKFRFVDNIVFENKEIVDKFLEFWRKSDAQRMAYLYGTYTKFEDVPLGIKAEVKALYEPKQKNDTNNYTILKDANLNIADKIAKTLGLQRVGWIFTDLIELQRGKVVYTRNSSTYFLSAKECIRAGHLQNIHPNKCRYASEESYGSKFVTVVASGNEENQISFEGYQISTQGMSIVADKCLLYKNETPELGYLRKSDSEHYVSDVYYKEKDEYGNIVSKKADHFSIGYLLTEVTVA